MTKNGEKDELFYITNENYQFFPVQVAFRYVVSF